MQPNAGRGSQGIVTQPELRQCDGCHAAIQGAAQPGDLAHVPPVPWAWVDERVYAAVRGCSVRVLQHERRLNIGCPFRRINGTSVRYKFGDIVAFLESQPGGGGSAEPSIQSRRGRGRPRRFST